jgi:hypothetical protein
MRRWSHCHPSPKRLGCWFSQFRAGWGLMRDEITPKRKSRARAAPYPAFCHLGAAASSVTNRLVAALINEGCPRGFQQRPLPIELR